MRILEWAFEQDLPTAEKLVLVYLASNANLAGVGPMTRGPLANATGYKKRSIQRLLKSLRDSGHFHEHGDWYAVGAPPLSDALIDQLAEFPADMRPEPPITRDTSYSPKVEDWPIFESLAQTVGDYVLDQFANFENRITEHLERLAMFHVTAKPEPPPPDPVLENPLFRTLRDAGVDPVRAYDLSLADLNMDEEHDNDTPPALGAEVIYEDNEIGRCSRIADILQGTTGLRPTPLLLHDWRELEALENKHTVKGEVDNFELIYPAIVAAAHARAGQMSIEEFIDIDSVEQGCAPWDYEINPVDKEDPKLMAEIAQMLIELEAANNPSCVVHGRTVEKLDDGGEVTETLLSYHRRVEAKYREMKKLKAMGAI